MNQGHSFPACRGCLAASTGTRAAGAGLDGSPGARHFREELSNQASARHGDGYIHRSVELSLAAAACAQIMRLIPGTFEVHAFEVRSALVSGCNSAAEA